MNLLPFETFTIQTELPFEDVKLELEKEVREGISNIYLDVMKFTINPFSIKNWKRNAKEFSGGINNDGFNIAFCLDPMCTRSGFGNWIFLIGKFVSTSEGTKISVKCRDNLLNNLASMIALCLQFVTFYNLIFGDVWVSLTFFVIGALIYLPIIALFNWRVSNSKKILNRVFFIESKENEEDEANMENLLKRIGRNKK